MNKISIFIIGSLILWGCSQSKQPETKSAETSKVESSDTTQILNFNNNLFSIPSPHQVSKILVDLKIEYNAEMLNSVKNTRNYGNSFKKALNLGVYGADLGYVNLYDRTQEAISYFSVIKTLSQELNITNAFKKETFKSIENNLTNQDSLLFLLSNSYQDIDLFLKTNGQEHTGSLILAGGWIESMYLLTQFALSSKNVDLYTRIGENKHPLNNLIKILSQYTDKNRIFQSMIDKLSEIEILYDNIQVQYTFKRSENFPDEKTTKIHSETTVIISDDDLKKIASEISNLRNFVIL